MSATTLPTPITTLGFDPDYLAAFEDKLFIEGPQTARARRLMNFCALLLFATVIPTVLTDLPSSLSKVTIRGWGGLAETGSMVAEESSYGN
jgi:hypothetical protein